MVKAELANDIIIDKMPYAAKKDFFNYIVILIIINGNDKILSELPTSLLTNAGFSSKYIKKLIEKDGVIERIRRGIYQISPSIIEKLFDFGASLQETGAEDLAVKVFDGCYKLDPTYISVKCFNTFCNLIENNQYDEAIELYKSLCAGKYSFVTDFRYYLFLLDKVTKLPFKLDRLFKGFTANGMPIYNQIEIAEDDARFTPEERQARNNMRAAVAKNDVSTIIEQYHSVLDHDIPQDRVEVRILHDLIAKEDKYTTEVESHICRGRFEDAMNILKTKEINQGLTAKEQKSLLRLGRLAIGEEFLKERHQELENSRIILLGPLDEDYVEEIKKMNDFSDMTVEKISFNGQEWVLLRKYFPNATNFEGIKEVIEDAFIDKSRYTKELFYALLESAETADKIPFKYYANLGSIEKKHRKYSQAVTCFMLASAFAPTQKLAIKYRNKAYYIAKEFTPIEEYLPEEAIPIKAQTNKKLIKVQSPDS